MSDFVLIIFIQNPFFELLQLLIFHVGKTYG